MLMNEQIQRIEEMEETMCRLENLLEQAEQNLIPQESLLPVLETLSGYYTSPLWMADYEADEQGLLPSGLKRGVLSQDGVYNLLMRCRVLGLGLPEKED